MEDASKEFQVFLSPPRNYTVERPIQAPNKHRIVPVINKCPSASSFVMHQRKNSVLYKAVSGVSFQETDVYEELKSTNRQKQQNRTDSLGKSSSNNGNEPGARRSRSLTNMKGDGFDPGVPQACAVTEITHPCTPVILYGQTRGRQSRYARARERRRASSQARPNLDNLERNNRGELNPDFPVKPRRTRSVSRTRKKAVMQSFSSESSLNDPDLLNKKGLLNYDENHYLITSKKNSHAPSKKGRPTQNIYEDPKDLDLRVNDTDWEKYGALITEKLDSLLRTRNPVQSVVKPPEEPEGGYFSLERDETETADPQTVLDAFQQDHDNETIYVSQTFREPNRKFLSTQQFQKQPTELHEMELADYSTVHEVGYPEDEGLYEEIFFDSKETQQSNPFYQLNVRENQAYFNAPPPPKTPPPEQTHYVPIIERKENSTVVYIRCNDIASKKSTQVPKNVFNEPSQIQTHIGPIGLQFPVPNSSLNPSVSLESIHSPREVQNKEHMHSVWCSCCNGCSTRRSQSVSHSSSCIQGKSGLMTAKYASLVDLNSSEEEGGMRFKNAPLTPKISRSKRVKGLPQTQTGITKSTSAANLRISNPQTHDIEPELSDIDLEIFAPKLAQTRKRKENLYAATGGCVRPTRYLKRKDYTSMRLSSGSRDSNEGIPKTFKGVLQNSIFNPPYPDSLVDEESLVIKEHQTVTCITDSSSSDQESADEQDGSMYASPWLEAKADFEFVAFKDNKKEFNNLSKRRKTNRLLSIHKMMYGSQAELDQGPDLPKISQHTDREPSDRTPERPSRRRTRRKPPKSVGTAS